MVPPDRRPFRKRGLNPPGLSWGMFKKYQAVFTSRWRALIWAAGVCLTAYCTVPSPDGDSATDRALEQAVGMAGGDMSGDRAQEHVNPWAKDAPRKH